MSVEDNSSGMKRGLTAKRALPLTHMVVLENQRLALSSSSGPPALESDIVLYTDEHCPIPNVKIDIFDIASHDVH